MDRFTQFPAVNDDGEDVHVIPWNLDHQLPSEVLALSWAVLLRAFTTDENPVFLLNGAPVKADLSTQTVQPADLASVADLSVKHTAVVLGDPLFDDGRHAPALRWTVDPTSQSGALCATGGMDAPFLYQLGKQLKQIVQEQAALKDIKIELSDVEVPTLAIANPEPAILPGPGLLHDLALRGFNDSNHAIEFLAADGDVRCLSYRDLDRLSSKLASEIARASTDAGQRVVPVLLPQSVELYIAWLAILKSGAAFCPLNTDAPTDRIEFILQDVAASVVITNGALTSRIPPKDHISILTVDDLQTDKTPMEPFSIDHTPHLAYVMYTSGSTGRPKGVGVSHLAATQSLLAHDDLIPQFKRFLQFASPTFDVSVFEVFFPMMRGATLIGSERENMLLDISHVMTTMKVDAAELTPTVAGELLRTRAAAPSLRVLLTIGEMLTRHVVDEFGQSESGVGILHGMYGPTEAAIHCTAATHFKSKDRVNMIGTAFTTVSAYIMSLPDESNELRTLSLGQIGELVVGGPQLADGYINRPEENAKAFIDSPLYGRLYRTGDKARMLPSGEIECFGRISSGQVKLRGQRIELGEIEHVITRASGVRSAVTLVIDGNLVAFVLVTDKGVTDSSLRDVCRQLLPRFMIPGEFVLVDQFPQLPSGKIDRKTLEADFIQHRNNTQSVHLESRDDKEESIVSCVADVLGRRLAPTESLAAAGLDSLAAIRLASYLLDAGIRLGVAALIEADSIEGIWQLASLETDDLTGDAQAALQAISELVAEAGVARLETLNLGPVSELVPCTHIQQAMLLETVRHDRAYCNWIELEFDSTTPTELKIAFSHLLEHNEILRSGFVEIGLKDHSYGRFTWSNLETQVFQVDALEYDVSMTVGHDILNPFKVQIKEETNSVRALVHIHHSLYDGWSWQIMLQDLRDILSGEQPSSRPSYAVVTNFFIEQNLSKSSTDSASYWHDQLQGLTPTSFPTFHGSTVKPKTSNTTRILQTPISRLGDVSHDLRVSRQTIFQAAFTYILSTYLGTSDITFGTVFSGRTLPLKGIETILGPCIRTLPTRMDIAKMQNVSDLLLAIQNMNHKSLEHGSLPLQDIKKASGIDLARNLFDTALVWQESIWAHEHSGFREVDAGEFLEFALLLEFEPREKHIFARATFQHSVLSSEQADLLLAQIDAVAQILIERVDLPIAELRSHLPRETLSYHAAPAVQCQWSLASGVEIFASTDPHRIAAEEISWKETTPCVERITYGQLNSRANSLAHLLLHVGVSKGDLIPILLTSSIDFYVSVLGIVKAGAGVLILPQGSDDIHSLFTKAKPKFCIVDSLAEKSHRLPLLKLVQRIHLSYSLDVYHDLNIPYNNKGSHIAYAVVEARHTNTVLFSRQSLQSNINALSIQYPTPTGSKIFSSHPQSIPEIFLTWQNGATLCSVSGAGTIDNLQQACQELSITHLHLTPTLASHINPKDVPTVQYLLTSGEQLNYRVHRNWAGRGLYQAYSSQELAGPGTILQIGKSTSIRNVGRPLGDTFVVVLDTSLSLLPRGAVGELCFGGDHIGRYLPGSEIPAERFIDHAEYGHICRTGDYGRLLADGTIVLERDSGLRGIDLDAVDRVLSSLEGVHDFASLVFDSQSGQELAVVWVPASRPADSEFEQVTKDLFAELMKNLPLSSVPSLLVPVDHIDITSSYKVDYTMLKERLCRLSDQERATFSLRLSTSENNDDLTDVEKIVIAALSTITGTDQNHIGKHTSFYKLGLDSLSAISFSRKLQESGCGRLAVSTILRHSSVFQLASVIPPIANENGHDIAPVETESREPTVSFDRDFIHQVECDFKAQDISVQDVYPCTPLQEAMLAAESGGQSAYFNHLLLLVHSDAEAMRTAWSHMMQRHGILRTCFMQTNDKRFAYAQVVLDTSVLPWNQVEAASNEFDELLKEKKSEFEGISPVNGQLPYSLTLITDSAAHKTHLLLSIHHALYDGEGISQLLHELQLSLSGSELPTTTPFHQFIDYMTSVDDSGSDKYWKQYLTGVSPTLLPTASAANYASQQIHTSLKASFGSFKQQCKDLSVSPLNVFHAAWARLLSLYTESPDVCFGNVFSCRTIPLDGADQIVGPCFNTLPVRGKFSSTATNHDLLKSSQKSNSDILPHQLTSLRRIQRIVGAGTRLFDTLLILQNRDTGLDANIWELLQDEGNMGFPLICEIVPDDATNTVQICMHFQESHISHVAAESVARDFVTLVEHISQYPSAQASDKTLLGTQIPGVFEQVASKAVSFRATKSLQTRPWSYQEEAVRDILCKFSDVQPEDVSQDTTIFQLGLDSINAVQISAKLRGLGYKISSGDILEAASIDQIASLLNSLDKLDEKVVYDFESFQNQHLQLICEQLGVSGVQSLYPCTPLQNGMLAAFTHSNGDVYFNRMALNFSTPLNSTRLKEAWSEVVAQHEMLRTGFVQLRDQQHPFAMLTYDTIELPWYETSAGSPVQEKTILENLHQPPWSIEVDAGEEISVLYFSALHAIYDAQSLSAIFADVKAKYEGKPLAPRPPITETLGPILIESKSQSESAKFWKDLAPEVHPSKFPDLHPTRTDDRTLLSHSIRCSQSRKSLEDECRNLGVTLQAAAQTAWARLLSAYTGESSVTFGTVLSGRNLSTAAQDAVFPCLVTVPTPLRVEGANRELLDRTLKRNAFLVKNQFAPLANIQRWLGSDEPLFDTLFVYQKFASSTTGWDVVDEKTKIDYPISIELIPHSTDLQISLSFRSDVVPVEQASVLLDQYDRFLQDTIFSPDADATSHASVGSSLLSVTPAKEAPIPAPVDLLHQFVEVNALRIPDKTAFEFAFGETANSLQKRTWTYRQFNESGNQIAHLLQKKGAVPGGIVAICFDKCPEASMAILGILKAGCAYLALDPGAPISRKQFMLEDSGTKVLLSSLSKKDELEKLEGIDVQALNEPNLFDGVPTTDVSLARPINPDDTCYCLYTSGTTGTPKGCEITHDNAVQAMLAFQRLFAGHWDEESRWLQFASFHFDVSVLEQYWSWSVGICVTSCPRDLLFEDLPGTIQKLQITHIDLTPSLARLVHPDEVPSLCRGVFITGGEALKQEILDAWGKHGVIYNGYGPTEVTIGCTMLPRMSANDKASNIGPQFDNVGSYVFSPGTTIPVLRGGIGELCVSGPLVGKGYLNRAELTKERFQDLAEFGDRIYRTGDLVRILHDGSFQFLGRIDDQVKLRGQRLEIGEINEVIKQATPELNEVATLVITHPKQAKDQLVSFFTTVADKKSRADVAVRSSEDDRLLLSKIKAACSTHLPGYMVPTHIIPMTRFPLSANNKADMKVLKAIYQDLTLDEIQKLGALSADQPTGSAHEEKIVDILTKFIGSTDTISPSSSIYELGLDSISVIAFSRSLREAGFSQAQPSIIMKHPTIVAMASALQSSTSSGSVEAIQRNAKQGIVAFAHKNSRVVIEHIGISDNEVEKIAPCTPLQEGIIYHFLSSTTPLYCSSFTFELDKSIDVETLRGAWAKTQKEVQMLRAKFAPSPDGYAQAVLKQDTLPWFSDTVATQHGIDGARKQRHEAWTSQLDGLAAQLWEVGVISSPDQSVMCLNIFHALYDGNSLVLLLESVARNYLGQGKDVPKAPEFLDVLHLGPLCKDPAAEKFWKEHLAGCHDRPFAESGAEDTPILHKAQINGTDQVDHLRRSLNVTEQAVLHTCWLLALQQQYSFVPPLGIIASGRTIDVPGVENVIGPLFNTIPSNVQLIGLDSWADVARRCHDYHVSMIPFQYTALRDIVKWLGKSPDERLFNTLFVFQREDDHVEPLAKDLWQTVSSEAEHEYPLAFEVVRNGNQSLTVTLAAKGNVVSLEETQQLLSKFETILSQFAQDPDRALPKIEGDYQPITNGVDAHEPRHVNGEHINGDQINGSTFEWTPHALTIRNVISTLAGVEVESIGENTSIFEVGLDSIDAIKISSRLSKAGIKLPVSSIMRHRTVKAMSAQLSLANGHAKNGDSSLLEKLEKSLVKFLESEGALPTDATRVLPATPIQEAMVAEMTSSGYEHYYNHEILELEPGVDLGRMEAAWRAVIRAHPILRTSFVEVWDPEIAVSYAQIVHSEDHIDIHTVHLHGVSVESIIETQVSKARNGQVGGPLLSVTIAVDGDKHYLVLSIAHALYDGWSINMLHEDVARSYAGENCARPSSNDILEQIISSSGDEALRYWRSTLANFTPAPFLPMEHSGEDSVAVHRAEKAFSVPLSNAETFCKRHGVTLQALLVSCWSLVLATHVKRLDVAFGLVLSGRNVADSEHVMFPTMNTVAMRIVLHGTRVELVKYVQEALLAMSEHQHFPLRRARPDTGSQALFDTLFMYQKRPVDNQSESSALYKSTGGSASVEYPVCAEVEGVGEKLVGRVAGRGNVVGDVDTLVLLDQMGDILSSIIHDSSEQTVEFTDDGVKVCGGSPFKDETGQDVVANGPRESHQTEWSPIESKIRNVLSIASGVSEDSIGKSSTIFELGLDSISAIKVAALLKKQSVKLAVSDMLRAGSIEKMATVANSSQPDFSVVDISGVLRDSLGDIDVQQLIESHGVDAQQVVRAFPTTAGQTYFLAMHTVNPEVFYPEFYYMLSEQLSPETLNHAWSQVVNQTPMLRTTFLRTESRLLPYIQVELEAVHIPVIWHSRFDPDLVSSSLKQEFGAVPVALHACQTAKGTALVLQIHHALYDGISLPHILDRLVSHCHVDAISPNSNSNSNLGLSQLVAFQHVHSPVHVRRQFWQKYLGQTPTAPKSGGGFGVVQHHYRPGLVPNMASIEKVAKRQGLSIQTIFLAIYARVHMQHFASETGDAGSPGRLIVGLYLANRSHSLDGLAESVIPTVNIVPLRLDDKLSDSPTTLLDAARRIQADITEISLPEYSSVSLLEIAEWTGFQIDTCVNFLRLPEQAPGNQKLSLTSIQREELENLSATIPSDNQRFKSNGLTPPGADLSFPTAFLPTIDVEAAVRKGRLDFGLFAPSCRLSPEIADAATLSMKREMDTLVTGFEFM
ncbi:unnamed protein product [Penicillium salamii]|uniref:Nonribosomal peptide synthetase sidC n=1 Tax=Penicillium salamii TaxID=1612424 RepID=A0A9W4NR30_9EURO|nr:unnamed protein product [Penicillium salamii]CAG8062233.1 unnamed protein product [Penicillium salamii]CAG8149481.1 unnamed protein product [Penicillium salamii]CAG8168821.1 unnamed protein product [Penicillium salamii]CAG8230602.1 unnamed protein product [Penicillium salamii]